MPEVGIIGADNSVGNRDHAMTSLSRAESRAIKFAYESSREMPDFPRAISTIYASGHRRGAHESTLESLCKKRYADFASISGRYYFGHKAREHIKMQRYYQNDLD